MKQNRTQRNHHKLKQLYKKLAVINLSKIKTGQYWHRHRHIYQLNRRLKIPPTHMDGNLVSDKSDVSKRKIREVGLFNK